MSKIVQKIDVIADIEEQLHKLASFSIVLEFSCLSKDDIDELAVEQKSSNEKLLMYIADEMVKAFSEDFRKHIILAVTNDVEYDNCESFDESMKANIVDRNWLKNGHEFKGGQ